MLGSLRFRLPALFLLGVVLSGLVTSLIVIRFFQTYTHTRAVVELRAESVGIVRLYARQSGAATVPLTSLERAIGGDRIFFVPAFPGAQLFQPLPRLPAKTVDLSKLNGASATTLSDLKVRNKKLSGRRAAAVPRRAVECKCTAARRARRRQADCAASKQADHIDRAARDRLRRRRAHRGAARRVSDAADHAAAARAVGGRRRDCGRQLRRRRARASRSGRDLASLRAVQGHGGEARRVGAALAQLPDVGVT